MTGKAAAAETEQLRAEIAELRGQLRAVGYLAVSMAMRHAPASTSGGPRTIADVCRTNGLAGDHYRALEQIFERQAGT